MPKLSVYNLGDRGVDVDSDPAHSATWQLTQAQNAIRDPLGGVGALRNRPGLLALNGSAAAGSISGGIGVPLTKISTRTFYAGRGTPGAGTSSGWNTSTNAFTSSSTISAGTPPALPIGRLKSLGFSSASGATEVEQSGSPGCIFQNRLYYAADGYVQYPTASHEAPPIRVWDGTTDRELCRIPANPSSGVGTNAQSVMTMITANGTIYLSTYDSGTSSADWLGRVFQLDPNTGTLTPIGPTFPIGYQPYAITWYLGRVWVGTSSNDAAPAAGGRVYYFRPGVDTTWTLDHTTTIGKGDVLALCPYRGLLYASTRGTALVAAVVKQRDTAGVWTEVDTTPYVGKGRTYLGMAVFNDVLYVSMYKTTTLVGTIRQYDGTSWSDALASTGQCSPVSVWVVDNGILFGLGYSWVSGTAVGGLEKTATGASWTQVALTTGNIPILGVITS